MLSTVSGASPSVDDRGRTRLHGDIRQLTGLRGIVALNVALSHYGLNLIPGFRLFSFAQPAVDLFFCLSGFTLCLVYGAGLPGNLRWRSYIVARVARVYPLFMLTTLVTLWYSLAWQVGAFPQLSRHELLIQFVRQATLLSEIPLPFIGPILGPMGCWNDSAWSISVEAACYVAIFPPLFALTRIARRMDVGTVVLAMVALGAICFVVFIKAFTPNIDDPAYPQPGPSLALWVPLIRGATMFGAGWLAYLLYLAHREAASFIGLITDTLALGFLAVVASEPFGLLSSFTVVIIVPFLVLGLMDGRTITARILASPPIHYLGVISYSLYLWHVPGLSLARRIWPWQDAQRLHGLLWPLALSLVLSVLSFHVFEMPARRAIKRWGAAR
jgi:peptidoglycan/LPS O-acetylase OafA/YrhL